MAKSSDVVIIAAVCGSVALLVMLISARYLLRTVRARNSAPLPPKQALAHHRTSYYQQPASPFGYYHSSAGGSRGSLTSKERFTPSREVSSSSRYAEDVQSIPSSIVQPPLQALQGEDYPQLAIPNPSFSAQATRSDSSLSAHSSEGSQSQGYPVQGDVNFPSDNSPVSTMVSRPNRIPRTRPLSYVSMSSNHTGRSTTRSFSSHAQPRRSGVPHDPGMGGVQIVLPAPLAPTYTGQSSSTPVSPREGRRSVTMPEKRLSFIDAWAPQADRNEQPTSSKLQRPKSSLRISHSPSSSTPPSPIFPNPALLGPSPSNSRFNTPSPHPSQNSLRRPSTAPQSHQSLQSSVHSSQSTLPLTATPETLTPSTISEPLDCYPRSSSDKGPTVEDFQSPDFKHSSPGDRGTGILAGVPVAVAAS